MPNIVDLLCKVADHRCVTLTYDANLCSDNVLGESQQAVPMADSLQQQVAGLSERRYAG